MKALRYPGFQRVVALLLFAGASAAYVPASSATTIVDAAFESELRTALGDAAAVETALEAARQAPTPEAAVDAFIRAYVAATSDPDTAADVLRLLKEHPNRFGAPAIPVSEAVWAPASTSAPAVQRVLSSILTTSPVILSSAAHTSIGPGETPVRPDLRSLRTQQARAP